MACKQESTCKYYDIVVIGKTGMGKSTTGNKLLNIKRDSQAIRHFVSSIEQGDEVSGENQRFLQADHLSTDMEDIKGTLSVTSRCKLLANDKTRIRVLDVPGFSHSDPSVLSTALGSRSRRIFKYEGDQQIVRWIVRTQIEKKLKIKRVVYFLPNRGALETVYGDLQEELAIMQHYFGAAIFDCMIIAATYPPNKKFQMLRFDDKEIKLTQKTFHRGLLSVSEDKDIKCPPLIFIGHNDDGDDILREIKRAPVLNESILPLEFQDDVCSRCGIKIRISPLKEKIGVVGAGDELIAYEESKCHPTFVPKYSALEKVTGGISHVATLGIGLIASYLADVSLWPGFTNSEEICPNCKKSPGSKGCCYVNQSIRATWLYECEDMLVYTDHSIKLD